MSHRSGRLDDDYFARVYAEKDDPWGFETRSYERRKYALTVAALPRERYRRVFEPGCASGVLTESLAGRADELLAMELVPRIAARARARLDRHPHVKVLVGALPETWPDGSFDLVVASEVLYYLTEEGFDDVLRVLDQKLEPGAHLVAVHWRGVTDYPLTGDRVHECLAGHPLLHEIVRYEEKDFRLGVYARS